MNEHSFRAAIVADPLDDALRLVFADWLDDHDQPLRAEFIRTQILLAQFRVWYQERRQPHPRHWQGLDPVAASERLKAMTADVALWRSFYLPMFDTDAIGGGVKPVADDCTLGWCWRQTCRTRSWHVVRGFVGVVGCRLREWLAYGPRIVRENPVHEVQLWDRAPRRVRERGFRWTLGHGTAASLPRELFGLLRGGEEDGDSRFHARADECQSDLLHAAVSWARQATGLPASVLDEARTLSLS